MDAAFRPTWTGEMPDWMEPFRRTTNAAKKYVVSSTLKRGVDAPNFKIPVDLVNINNKWKINGIGLMNRLQK